MANINVEGTLKASLTVGNIVGVTDKKLEEALSTKADINHIHEEYLTEHQDISHLATKEYVNTSISSIEIDLTGYATEDYVNEQIGNIPEVDLSNHVTNEQLTAVLETKANVEHNHDNEYVSQSLYEELSSAVESNSEKINDNEISIINNTRKLNTLAAQKLDPDTSYDSLLTNDKTIIGAINEIFGMVRSLMSYTITVNYIDIDGNVIQDPYIFTVKPDEEYNVDDEVVIDGYFYSHTEGESQGIATDNIVIDIIYKANPSSEFYAEYRIDNETSPIDTLQSNGYLPTISEGMKVFALKTDGQYTDKLDTLVSEIDTIRVEYPEETKGFMFPSKLIELVSINITNFTSFNSMFAGCSLLKLFEATDWDTTNITSFSYMFENCENLLSFNAPNWNTSNVTRMNGMFDGCISLINLRLDNWDTSNVDVSNDKAEDMFYGVPILTDEQWGFDSDSYVNFTLTEYQTGYKGIFPWTKEPESTLFSTTYTINPDSSSSALYSGDIKDETNFAYGSYMPKFDTGHTYVELLLNDGTITTNLDVPALEVQQATVWYSEETKDISFINTKVKDVTYINLENIESLAFTDCAYLESVDLSKTTTKGNCVHEGTFEGVSEECKITISRDWETTEEQSGFTGKYNNPWKYYIKYSIDNSIGVNLDWSTHIPSFTTDKNCDDTEQYTQEFNLIEVYLKDGNIVTELLEEVLVENVDLIMAYYPEETVSIKAPFGIKTLWYVNIEKFRNLHYMFTACNYLTEINGIGVWDVSNIVSMAGMFYGCDVLKSLDLPSWNIDNVENMISMFENCSSLRLLNLSTWNTHNIEEHNKFEDMFKGLPEDIDWCYKDDTYYANWTLTEEQTGFSGTFPWNKQKEPDSPYYIEYTFSHNDPSPLLYETSAGHNKPYYINIPKIYDADSNESYNYEFVKITLNEGEVINAASLDTIRDEYGDIYTDEVACIRIYYPEETSQLRFFNPGSYVNTCRMRTLEYINVKNFTSYENMFYNCSHLEHIVPDMNIWDWNKKIDSMFSDCSSLTTLDLSHINTDYIISCYGMLRGVPQDLDWCYNGSNYQDWSLTEEQIGFRGIFPWTKRISKTIMSNRMNYGEEITVLGNDGISITSGRIGCEIEETEGGFIIEIPEFINRLSVECTSMNLMYNYIYIFDSEDHIIYLDDTYNAFYTTNPFYQYDGSPSGWADSQISQVIYRIAKEDILLSEKYKGEFGDYYYALPYIPDFEYKLDSGDIEIWILNAIGEWRAIFSSRELSNYVCTDIECIGIIDRYNGNLNGLRFGNSYINDACSIISSLLYLNVPEVDDNIFACCQQLETINLSPEGFFKPEFTKNNPLNLPYCEQLKVVNLGLDPIVVADAFKGTYENVVIFTADKGTLSDCGTFTGAAILLQYNDSDKK